MPNLNEVTHCTTFVAKTLKALQDHFILQTTNFIGDTLHCKYLCKLDNKIYNVTIKTEE